MQHLEVSNTFLPLLTPTATPTHDDSDPYYELTFQCSQFPTEINFGTARVREPKSCKLNVFNDNKDFLSAVLNTMDLPIHVDILRLPMSDTESTSPVSAGVLVLHLPPRSSALLRITWSPNTPDDLDIPLVFKCNSEFTSTIALYGKVETITKKSQKVLFGDTQASFVKRHDASTYRAPLSTLTFNSPLMEKRAIPQKHHTLMTTAPSNTFLFVDDSVLSLPSRSFIASTPMERNATRTLISIPAEHSFVKPSVIKSYPANGQEGGDRGAVKRSLTFSLPGPGAGYFDTQWADKQIRAFTNWLNFILVPQDSSNFTSLQSDSSPSSRRGAINLTSSLRSLSSPPRETGEPRYSITQRKYLSKLRSNMQALYSSRDFTDSLYQLHAEIEKSRLTIRPEKPVWKDVGLKEDLLHTLLSYHPLWLRLGLEAIFCCSVPVSHEMDSKRIHKFLLQNLFNSKSISTKFSHRRVPGLFTKGHDQVVSKYILLKYFSLILILDMAKNRKLIDHDPCLFNKNSRLKSSRDMLLYFSSSFLQGEGDITKHLNNIGYRVSQKQSFLDEFDYQVRNMAVDLRDGIRLSRLLELLTQEWGLSQKLRIPATSMNPRMANNKLILDKLKDITQFDFNISNKDIAIGHKEKTLSLIWALIFHFRVAIKLDDSLLRKEIAFIRAKHSIRENCIPIKLRGNDGCDQFNSDTLQLLLEWSSVICRVFGLRVTDFTSSFKDGRALCYILHYYHPALLSKHFICEDAVSNLEEFSHKLSSLGGIPTLPPPSDFFQTGPNEKVVIMYLAYLCGQQLELGEEIRAAIVIQRAYKRYTCMVQQNRLEQSSYDSQLSEFRTLTEAAVTIQTRYRGAVARREAKRLRENRTRILNERLTATFTMQKCYRKWSSHKLAISTRTNYLTLKRIVIRIQKTFRRRNFLPKESRPTNLDQDITLAAVTIQSIYRGSKIRRELARVSCENNKPFIDTPTHQERMNSIITIQRYYRKWSSRKLAFSTRSNYLSLKRIAVLVQKAYRKRILDTCVLQERMHSIITIQRCYKKWSSDKIALSVRESYLSLKSIVIEVQCAFRLSSAKKRHGLSLIESTARELVFGTLIRSCLLINEEIEKSTIAMQSLYRGLKARRELKLLAQQENERRIQSLACCVVGNIIISSSTKLQQQMLASTLTIQRNLIRSSANKLALSERANYLFLRRKVVHLQRAVGKYLAAKKHNNILLEARVYGCIHSVLFKSLSDLITEQTVAAITIQSFYRGTRTRRELTLLRYEQAFQSLSFDIVSIATYNAVTTLSRDILLSTLTIQQCYQRWAANRLAVSIRHNYIALKSVATSVQLAFRRRRQEQMKCNSQAAVCIQAWWRSSVARANFITQKQAATRIQHRFRSCPTYLRNRQLEIETNAAITIQSFYRGYHIRRNMESSLLGIKRRLSDATKSADTFKQLKNKIPKYLDILLNSRSLAQKYDILDNLRTAVYVSESCAIRVRREGLHILYMLVDNHVRSPSIMQRVEKAADVLLQLTKWPSISSDIFIYGESIPIITNLLQKISTSQPSTVRVLCHLLIAFCKHPDQVVTIHKHHHVSIQKIQKVLTILKRRYSVGASRMLVKAKKDLAISIYELERVFTHFRYVS